MYRISDSHHLHVGILCKPSHSPSSHYRIVTTCSIVHDQILEMATILSFETYSVSSHSILPSPQGLACQYWQFESYGVFIQKIPHPSFDKRGPPG